MTKLHYLLAVVGLLCIITTSSLPACLASRPFPADEEAAVSETSVEPMTTDEASDSDSKVTSMSFIGQSEEDEDEFSPDDEEVDNRGFHPCFATLAEVEGRTDTSEDGDVTLFEVECRRILRSLDYSLPNPNKNPKTPKKCRKHKKRC
ncbi:hypothetical protein R1flu_028105 [Riccia fluitans]|uniref:Uncharacterized protein n=1 Tax=Riccia fluitans TaxID=41844 RepID=A0ABD1XKQ3_9MARC